MRDIQHIFELVDRKHFLLCAVMDYVLDVLKDLRHRIMEELIKISFEIEIF